MECGVREHLRLACGKLVELEHTLREETQLKIEQTMLPLQRGKDEIWRKIEEDRANQKKIQENVISKQQQEIEKLKNEHREEMNEFKRQTEELKKERQPVQNMSTWKIAVVIILCATATWYYRSNSVSEKPMACKRVCVCVYVRGNRRFLCVNIKGKKKDSDFGQPSKRESNDPVYCVYPGFSDSKTFTTHKIVFLLHCL